MDLEQVAENKEVYRFNDFTHGGYRSYIQQLKEKGFNFSFYHELDKESKFVLFRHDVDFSPQRALQLAKIEAEMGIHSTYFIHLHSRFYHALEKEIQELFLEVKEMGHQLALHFDFAFYSNLTEENIESILKIEKTIIEHFYNTEVKVFSFHNPNEWALKWGRWEAAGMINTYADYFMNEVRYGSDSNGIWRNENFQEIIDSNPDKLQLLTHPVWWTKSVTSPKERVKSVIDGRASNNFENQLQHWKNWGREFIDW